MNIYSFSRRIHRASRRGFTLMEMLIVLVIISLLMGMVIYNIIGFGSQAEDTKARADILGFKEMLAGYQLQTGSLPTSDQGLSVLWKKPTVEPIPTRWRATIQQETLDPWGHHYIYLTPGKHNPDSYDVYSAGRDGKPDTDDDIGNWPDAPASK